MQSTLDIVELEPVPAGPIQPPDISSSLVEQQQQQQIVDLRQWLQSTDYLSPGNEFMKHLHSHVPGTGNCVNLSPIFRSWAGFDPDAGVSDTAAATSGYSLKNKVSCLHVRGVAGSGKSVFAANTIRQLQKMNNTIVLFFFFRQIVDKNHAAKYLVRDFAAQLLPYCPSLITTLTELSKSTAIDEIELSQIWSILVKAITDHHHQATHKRVFCIVDALDEMDDGDFDNMINKLINLGTESNPQLAAAVGVMMTSRPLPGIEQVIMKHQNIARLKLDPALLSSDVAKYVDSRMASLRQPLNQEKNNLVKRAICKRANGLFLYARLITDNLSKGLEESLITEESLPNSLDRLPRTLQEVYETMLKDYAYRSNLTTDIQAKVLMCVTHSSRPLRLIELASILQHMLKTDLGRAKQLVRDSCGALLELLEDETVSVIHHSFTEFLHDVRRKQNKDGFPVLEDAESHATLVEIFLEYLNDCPQIDITIDDSRDINYESYKDARAEEARRAEIFGTIRLDYPLAAYAIENISFHMDKVAEDDVQSKPQPKPMPNLDFDSEDADADVNIDISILDDIDIDIDTSTSTEAVNRPRAKAIARDRVTTAIDAYFAVPHKCAALQIWMLVTWKYSFSSSVTIFHLICSTVSKFKALPLFVIDHFCQNPAFADMIDAPNHRDGKTPLAIAARAGNDGIVGLLLQKGANPISYCYKGLTPLHWAIDGNSAGVVRILLDDAGVDPEIKTLHKYNSKGEKVETEEPKTAVSYAIETGFEPVLDLFLSFISPADSHLIFHRSKTVDSTSKILQKFEIDINSYDRGFPKLFKVVADADIDMIQLLLRHNADPNRRAVNYDDDSPKLILAAAADVDSDPDNKNLRTLTPLHHLVRSFKSLWYMRYDAKRVNNVVKALVSAGADINATMDEYRENNLTPLHLAVQKPWGGSRALFADDFDVVITKALLEAGADVNAETSNGDTALHLNHRLELFDLLVESGGGNVDSRNTSGRSPLLEMIHRAETNRRPEDDTNATMVFVLDKLVTLGANTALVDNWGNTIFHHILSSIDEMSKPAYLPFVQRVLASNTNDSILNQTNHNGNPPIFCYSVGKRLRLNTNQDEELLKLLIDNGMDMNATNQQGIPFIHNMIGRYGMTTEMIDKFIRLGPIDLDVPSNNADGTTLLQQAVASGDLQSIEYLISMGCDATIKDKNRNTLIHTAIIAWRRDMGPQRLQNICELLTKNCVDPLAINAKGQSAFHLAATHQDILSMVLESPCFKHLDINLQDNDGFTALHRIRKDRGYYDMATMIKLGADVTIQSHSGLLPLHSAAAKNGSATSVYHLLALSRKHSMLEQHINCLGDGRAPLHYACKAGDLESVRILLENGADPTLRDNAGLTPLHVLAAEFDPPPSQNRHHYGPPSPLQTPEIVRRLYEAGADIDSIASILESVEEEDSDDRGSKTTQTRQTVAPIDLAVEKGRWEVVRELISCGVKPQVSYLESREFRLLTDKDEAAIEAARLQKNLVDKTTANDKLGRLPSRYTCRGRWAIGSAKDLDSDKDITYIISSAESLLEAVNESDNNSEIREIELLYAMLLSQDFDTIKEYAQQQQQQGGDITGLNFDNRGGDNNFFHAIVRDGGFVRLVESFGDQISKFEANRKPWDIPLLHTACWNSPSMRMIRILVGDIGVDIEAAVKISHYAFRDYKSDEGTALHQLACGREFWQIEAIEYLLSQGANVEAHNLNGMTPLMVAVDSCNSVTTTTQWPEEFAQILLEYGADANARVPERFDACINNEQTKAKTRELRLESTDGLYLASGLSTLHLASNPRVIRLLLGYGATVDNSPGLLIRAVRRWMEPETISLLLDAGVDPNECPPEVENHRKRYELKEMGGSLETRIVENRRYALHEAAQPSITYDYVLSSPDFATRQSIIIKRLLSAGADPFSLYPDGSFILQRVIEDHGRFDFLVSLLPSIIIDINRKGSNQRTLLISACIHELPWKARLADADYDYPFGQLPTPIVVLSNIHALLRLGADISQTDDKGRTALHWISTLQESFNDEHRAVFLAIHNKNTDIIHVPDNEGRKPIHLALSTFSQGLQPSWLVIRCLVSMGADIKEPDPLTGNSVLHFIAPRLLGQKTLALEVELVFRQFASQFDINSRNRKQETPIFTVLAASLDTSCRTTPRRSNSFDDDIRYIHIIDLFVGLGADLMISNNQRQNLLHAVVSRPLLDSNGTEYDRETIPDTFKRLMELGVDPNAEDNDLRTSIDIAVARGLIEVMWLFGEDNIEYY